MPHGEYKTPGGKLIAVDFQAIDGVLRDVMVSGDFFLYPEDALISIVAALEGVAANLPPAALAERVRSAMAPGTELQGSSPEAIAAAIGRGLAAEKENLDDR